MKMIFFSLSLMGQVAMAKKEVSSSACSQHQKILLGAGCYWGTEKFIRQHSFSRGTVHDVRVGFAGGATKNPTYRQVCSGTTGHVEVAEVSYEGSTGMLEEMLKFFFQFHDPTTIDRQGNDRGTQYASVVFGDEEQRKVARLVIDDLQKAMNDHGHTFQGNKVVTQVREIVEFWPAHEEHQKYLEKNPNGYCNHRFYLSSWPGTKDIIDPELKTSSS